MSNISKAAGLSLTYTNHCVRATTATVLAHSGVSSLGIMSVTGHRNEKSIQSYVNAPSVSQRRQYSETLQRVATGVVSQCNLTSPAPPSSASTSSVAVREVSESTMLGGGSLFCGSSFHVAGEGQLHINVYTVPFSLGVLEITRESTRSTSMHENPLHQIHRNRLFQSSYLNETFSIRIPSQPLLTNPLGLRGTAVSANQINLA